MKHLLLTTIAAVVLVGCGESQQQEPPSVKASGAKRKLAEWFKMPRIVKFDPNAKRLVAAATLKTTR
jgi:ABC-type Fe3+-hydroxamate transport system substrate-binding protein